MEHELSYTQRNLVRDAHGSIHLYDTGLRNNFSQVFGWNRRWGWVHRLLCGGGGYVFHALVVDAAIFETFCDQEG
jgi:palmitoyltransferase